MTQAQHTRSHLLANRRASMVAIYGVYICLCTDGEFRSERNGNQMKLVPSRPGHLDTTSFSPPRPALALVIRENRIDACEAEAFEILVLCFLDCDLVRGLMSLRTLPSITSSQSRVYLKFDAGFRTQSRYRQVAFRARQPCQRNNPASINR
jgi:hypothetical protein